MTPDPILTGITALLGVLLIVSALLALLREALYAALVRRDARQDAIARAQRMGAPSEAILTPGTVTVRSDGSVVVQGFSSSDPHAPVNLIALHRAIHFLERAARDA